MKKIIILFGFIFLLNPQRALRDKMFYNANGIEGVIFSYPLPTNVQRMETLSWTPTVAQVLEADSLILAQNFKKLGGEAMDSFCTKNCPVIAKNWRNYLRQAIGYLNEENDSLVHLSFIWKADSTKYGDWKTENIEVLGSCSKIWSASVDLKRKVVHKVALPEIICYDLD
ncbi:MAG: hypothetical protein NXI09_15105 [Bacteroidetes bacterium]|nr:hypothetical protein [Bacteroidota bacterium]